MERIGQSMLLLGVVIAIAASLPLVAEVIANAARPNDFASELIGPGWVLGAVVGFVGLLVTAFGDRFGSGQRAV
jgi:hypothetical protein